MSLATIRDDPGMIPDCTVELLHRNSPGGFPQVDDSSFFQWAGLSWSTHPRQKTYPHVRKFGRSQRTMHLLPAGR
jgi:hypothetical protein